MSRKIKINTTPLDLSRTVQVQPRGCPECGIELSAASGGGNPHPGDACVCIQCGSVLIYCQNMDLRIATEDEFKLVLTHPEAALIIGFILARGRTR